LARPNAPSQVTYKDYYQTLGVAKTATQDEIQKAFRKLARVHHPDMAKEKDKAAAETKFKEINEAYEVLKDPEKRQKYDTLGADWERGGFQQGPRGGHGGRPGGMGGFGEEFSFGGTGFSDFFEQFFGGRAGGRGPRGGGGHGFGFEQEPVRGGDVEADLLVTLEEALHGARKKISFRREGSSKVETYEVKIPKGVREGQRIRLAGQGQAGASKELSGDLYLRVRFAQHPDYRIEGTDLIQDVELPAWKAVLGTELSITTPDGAIRLRIPEGTQNGQQFRVKGRGLPQGADARGDLYVKMEIVVPKSLTLEQRRAWQEVGRVSGD
jgi:curved DNA-binding protein